jgi:hypothetical protein
MNLCFIVDTFRLPSLSLECVRTLALSFNSSLALFAFQKNDNGKHELFSFDATKKEKEQAISLLSRDSFSHEDSLSSAIEAFFFSLRFGLKSTFSPFSAFKEIEDKGDATSEITFCLFTTSENLLNISRLSPKAAWPSIEWRIFTFQTDAFLYFLFDIYT